MTWQGQVEISREVEEWIDALSPVEQAAVDARVDLLADRGPLLGMPHCRALVGKLWELRVGPWRIAYFLAPGAPPTAVLLTRWRKKSQATPRRELIRARNAMDAWLAANDRR